MNKEVKYPFEFNELRLTDKMLDVLGFSKYWAGSGDFYGERCFGIEGVALYRMTVHDETEDPCSGYCQTPVYQSEYFSSGYQSKTWNHIYFLHELYEDILENKPNLIEMFVEKTKEKDVNMYPYIKSYLEYKDNSNEEI
jgi:hypothetical protein